MTLNRFAKRRDANELEIVKALQARGAMVVRLDTPVDLLVGFMGRWLPIEVKLPLGKKGGKKGSKLNDKQEQFFSDCEANGLTARVIRTIAEADALLDYFLDLTPRGCERWVGSRSSGAASGDNSSGGGGV